MALHGPVRDERGPADPPTLSTGSAAGLAAFVARLHRGEIVSPGVSERVAGWLSAQRRPVDGGLGVRPRPAVPRPSADRGVSLWNKTGTITDVRGDVGVLSGPAGAVAYAVLAEWDDRAEPLAREEALGGMALVGAAVRRVVEGA